MEEILASVETAPGHTLYIAQLARKTILECNAAHLGFDGYFVFESVEDGSGGGLHVLSKLSSLDAAFRFAEILNKITYN